VFFAKYGDKFMPINITADIFSRSRRNSIEALVNNKDSSITLRLEGALRKHCLNIQSAVSEFVGGGAPDDIIYPYALKIISIEENWADIVAGLLILITPSIFGVGLILSRLLFKSRRLLNA
jgi:hypothetical protein